MSALFRSQSLLLLASLLALLSQCHSIEVRGAAVTGPASATLAQIKLEVNKAVTKVMTIPAYKQYAAKVKLFINVAFSTPAYQKRLMVLANATVLLPSSSAASVVSNASPDKLINITLYQVLIGNLNNVTLQRMPAKKALPTGLGPSLFKQRAVNAPIVSFSQTAQAGAGKWSTVVNASMYSGKLFTIHGVDKLLLPPGLTLP